MIVTTDVSRELMVDTSVSVHLIASRCVSPVKLPRQGTSVSGGGFDVRVRALDVRDDVVTKSLPAFLTGVSAPIAKAPVSGVPAWSPPDR
ncbi:hypothetical protein ABZV93_18935 [Actinopolymorpha sp. NPDC004070]|uniref:hypothetical protein n=1 Tax=Actinopolymorpha sp. NPDC004070 TaxID=3154548 RepID=UPI0033B84D4E